VAVYAPPFEEAIMRYPELEPTYLFNGAYPIGELQNKWLMAKASPIDHVLDGDNLALDGVSAQIKQLPGHSRAQIGVLVNGILFCGDTVIGEATLAKYKVPFGANIAQQIESIRALPKIQAERIICAHGEPMSDVHATADGVPILLHDDTVDRTTDGCGALGELSPAFVRERDAGVAASVGHAGFGRHH